MKLFISNNFTQEISNTQENSTAKNNKHLFVMRKSPTIIFEAINFLSSEKSIFKWNEKIEQKGMT